MAEIAILASPTDTVATLSPDLVATRARIVLRTVLGLSRLKGRLKRRLKFGGLPGSRPNCGVTLFQIGTTMSSINRDLDLLLPT
jgi:hypothetical protein